MIRRSNKTNTSTASSSTWTQVRDERRASPTARLIHRGLITGSKSGPCLDDAFSTNLTLKSGNGKTNECYLKMASNDVGEKRDDVEVDRMLPKFAIVGVRDPDAAAIASTVTSSSDNNAPFDAERSSTADERDMPEGGGDRRATQFPSPSLGQYPNIFAMDVDDEDDDVAHAHVLEHPSALPASIVDRFTEVPTMEPANLGTLMNDLSDMPFSLEELEDGTDDVIQAPGSHPFSPPSGYMFGLTAQYGHLGLAHQPVIPSAWLRAHVLADASATTTLINTGTAAVPSTTAKAKQGFSHSHASSLTRHKHWTNQEDETLRYAVAQEGKIDWKKIATRYFLNSRSAAQCKTRWKNHLQPGLVRGNWLPHEDKLIMELVSQGYKWADIAQNLPGRLGEFIRDRYVNVLDPSLKTTPWTKEEDEVLFRYQRILGNKWAEIGKYLPGRSENSVKNRYYNRKNSQLRKMKRAAEGNAQTLDARTRTIPVNEEAEIPVRLAARPAIPEVKLAVEI